MEFINGTLFCYNGQCPIITDRPTDKWLKESHITRLWMYIRLSLKFFSHVPGELYRMAVSWTCQRRGIGKKLFAAAVEFAHEQKYEKLSLRTSHFIQKHLLYQRAGFQIVKTVTYWVMRVVPVCVYHMDRVLTC